ncbi:hypothetical protein PFISCL1PPCAC_673, partial [Pristionchus fissidentatus]
EVRAMAQFEHVNLVRYHASWTERPPKGWQNSADVDMQKHLEQGKPIDPNYDCFFVYIQMKLCTHSLEEWLNDNQVDRDRKQMKLWFVQMVEAVAYIHEKKVDDKGVIHRDLKPSNIMFDREGRIQIGDFGIVSKFGQVDETHTHTQNIGTWLYQAPEQRYWLYSNKVDVFALGLIYAEMSVPMTGEKRLK